MELRSPNLSRVSRRGDSDSNSNRPNCPKIYAKIYRKCTEGIPKTIAAPDWGLGPKRVALAGPWGAAMVLGILFANACEAFRPNACEALRGLTKGNNYEAQREHL